MDFLAFISVGPLWVRLSVAVLVLPFTLFLDLITLLRSFNENCCGLNCCSAAAKLWQNGVVTCKWFVHSNTLLT